MYLPYFALVVVYLLLRYRALHGFAPSVKHTLSAYENVINVFPLFTDYLGKVLLPVHLSVFYDFAPVRSLLEGRALFSLAVCLVFALGTVLAFRNNRLAFFGVVLFLVPLLPALYIPGLGDSPLAERYLYLPSVGFILLVAQGYSWLSSRIPTRVILPLLSLVLVFYCAGAVNRNRVWADELSLWSDAVVKAPKSSQTHEFLGYALYKKGMLDQAIAEYQLGLGIAPSSIEAQQNLGAAFAAAGRTDEAMEQYTVVLSRNAACVPAHTNLGDLYLQKQLFREATMEYRSALQFDPYCARAYCGLGMASANMGALNESIRYMEAAARLEPDNPIYRSNLEIIYRRKNQP